MSEILSTSPQTPGDVVGRWADGGAAGADRAVTIARTAAPGWAALTAFERAQALQSAAARLDDRVAELSALVVREVGKPAAEARGELARASAILRYYAQAAFDADGDTLPAADGRSWLMARRRPRGVAGLIAPWNFPVAIPVWKLSPALAWGNTVVLKPAPQATACAEALVEALGLPEGVVALAIGGTATGRRVVEHPDVDVVSFTGSAAAGATVAEAAARLSKPVQCEMGGSNPSIVLDDADVAATARILAQATMSYSGQKCTATRRVIATPGIMSALKEALVDAVAELAVGDPADPTTVVGPLIDEPARDRVLAATRGATARGARALLGGEPVDHDGWFAAPVLLDQVDPGDEVAREEVFGPFCAIFEAPTPEAALALANASRYGLAAAVFTGDLEHGMRFADQLHAGLIRVNAATTGVDFHAPFGGEGASSYGPREQGRAARELYTSTHTILVTPSA
ncbi:MAG TPA: aldehyde dehydrogenase family protein [Baekduia sp.]|nr:aldehyde dehydrogenase family protein [Baekduia sp.]